MKVELCSPQLIYHQSALNPIKPTFSYGISHGFSHETHQFPMGFPMVFPWNSTFSHGFSDGFPMVFHQFPMAFPMVFQLREAFLDFSAPLRRLLRCSPPFRSRAPGVDLMLFHRFFGTIQWIAWENLQETVDFPYEIFNPLNLQPILQFCPNYVLLNFQQIAGGGKCPKVSHHPTIGGINSNRYLFWWCSILS